MTHAQSLGKKTKKPKAPLHGNDLNGKQPSALLILWSSSSLHARDVQYSTIHVCALIFIGTYLSGAGRRAVLEVEDGEVLPQREFVQYDREAEELDAHGVRTSLQWQGPCAGLLMPACPAPLEEPLAC